MPPGHTSCPLCGKVAPPDEAPPTADVAANLAAGRQIAAGIERVRRLGWGLSALESVLFALAMPVLLPGFLLTALMVRRWGNVPLSLILWEGVLITGMSYLSFEMGESPLAGLVFPLLLASCLACAALYTLRGWKGRLEGGVLLGYSALVTALMVAGGVFLYAGGGLILHRVRAPRFQRIVSDVPRELSPAEAVASPDLLVHARLRDVRLDAGAAGWRVGGAGIDVVCAAGEADAEPPKLDVDDLLQRGPELLGTRVALKGPASGTFSKWVAEDWKSQVRGLEPKGEGRWWCVAGGQGAKRVFLASAQVAADELRKLDEVLNFAEPEGIVAEIPGELLESTNGLGIRGTKPGDARGWALVAEALPRRSCAPVAGTAGALWIQAEGEEMPAGPWQGVLEWPPAGAGRSLALLARRKLQAPASVRPRVLLLGSVHAYRHAAGLTAEAAEGIPLGHWGSFLLGALLTAAGMLLSLRD